MNPLANLHGKIMPLDEVTISPLDRGFLFGDAVYEVLRIYQGKPWLEQEHFDRFERSIDEIHIKGVDMPRCAAACTRRSRPAASARRSSICKSRAGRRRASTLFRRTSCRSNCSGCRNIPTAIAPCARPAAASSPIPICAGIARDIKSTNLLGNVLANQASAEAGCAEALLYLPDGTLTEASHSTFFAVKNNQLHTTPLKANVLPSITRGYTLKLAGQGGIEVVERNLQRKELDEVDELFLVGTTCEILPIVKVDGKRSRGAAGAVDAAVAGDLYR